MWWCIPVIPAVGTLRQEDGLSQKRKRAKSGAAASQQGALASHTGNVSTQEHHAAQHVCLCDFSYELRIYSPQI